MSLKRFFSSNNRRRSADLVPESRRIEPAPKHKRGKSNPDDVIHEVVKLGGNSNQELSLKVEAEIKEENEQEVYQYDMPKAELGFGDLLKEHHSGERMPGISVSKKSSQTREALMRELEQMQPDIDRKPFKLPKKFVLPLTSQEEKVCLDQVFTKIDPFYPYILINKISFVLTPLSSFFDAFTDVNVRILDTRMRNRSNRQSLTLNSNVDYRGNLSLDYCFPARSLSKMFLYIQLEVQLMEVGEEWGTVMMKIEAEKLDFPVMEDFQPVAAVGQLPPSGLVDYKYDPTHLNLAIKDNHRKKLIQMHEDGDLADSTKPLLVKTGKVKYAQTSVVKKASGAIVDQSGLVDWSVVRNSNKAKQDLDEISMDPSGSAEEFDDSNLLKLRQQALAEQRQMIQRVNTNDDDSILSFEKEAAGNMNKNKDRVSFLVDDVREVS